jgi:hypothetical protein
MSQPREELDLAGEPLGAECGAYLGAEHLERDRALVPDVVREIDSCHPARAELALDHVPLGECVAQLFGDGARGGHRRTMAGETSNVNEAGRGDAADTNRTVPPRLPQSIHPPRFVDATARIVGDVPITNGRSSSLPCTGS